ncbi:phage recombination protein Bet [Ochrobactrum sp. AN78]|uniref:phage recombination protein Bet n=1 Tax=Ochrobactrum sp. AN78 TaxID=3039853 RepID=UPI002989E9AB|nr:phage recombination protein Bet [Ochrobactrum sp. AN78]MDH7790698.1 phage recombination protein Bet [Ochrobactrum sp. AN78]
MGTVTVLEHTPKQIALVKHTIAKDCNDDEFNLFMEAARSYGLDPFRKQIMPLVFGKAARDQSKRRMSIVVSRDGLRVIAQRCKNYRPASEPAEVIFNEEMKAPTNPKGIDYARVYLWQQDNKGEWFKVVGEAYWDEFAPLKDEWAENPETGRGEKTGRQTLDTSGNWAKMPVVMITKCAEAQALRAGWPDQFSGIYVEEELDRAKTLDLTASEIVAHNAEEERAKRIGAHNAITITWGDGWQLENVPLGEFADRAADFVKSSSVEIVRRWHDANKQPLQVFWAKCPRDALELKKIIEMKLAEKPTSKTEAAA